MLESRLVHDYLCFYTPTHTYSKDILIKTFMALLLRKKYLKNKTKNT